MRTVARRDLLGATAAGVTSVLVPTRAQAQRATIKIGVLTDMSGPYSDTAGLGSVVATQMAVEDYVAAHPNFRAEVVSADMQNKPDIGMGSPAPGSIGTVWTPSPM